jgi:lipoate synthase
MGCRYLHTLRSIIMTNPTIKIHNVETGEIVEREMTAKEISDREAQRLAEAQSEAAKAAEKAALLAKLGITEDEARLLLG